MSLRTTSSILSAVRARTTANDVGTYACIPLLEGDPTLMRLATAWPKVRPAELLNLPCPEAIPRDREVRWLWAVINPDPIPRWIELAGLPDAPHTRRACYVLIDNEAVLPDGTLALVVEQYIQRKIGSFLQSMLPRRARGSAPPPPPPAEESDARASA